MSNWTTGPSNGQDDTSPQSRDIAQADSGYDTIAPSKAAGHSSSSTAEADNAADVGKPLGASRSTQITARDALFREEFDVSHRGSAVLDHPPRPLSRGGTLKKKPSLSRKTSLKRGGSRRSSRAGSVRSVFLGDKEKYSVEGDGGERNSAFYTPVPTAGNPTEILATRFQAWRKVLKDLVAYFREIQNSYETRSKALLKVSNVVNNTGMPAVFLAEGKGGISDAALILRDFHKRSISECQKAKDIENDVIIQLNGLRSDLNLKIKEIKNLSSDFKNSVEKEMNVTRKAVHGLQEALGLVDTDPHATTGKGDPFIVKLGVDKQLEKQIDEENYLHRAFLNLEGSGRELESIVIGEIQKAYSALASILRREADEEYDTVEKLRAGPLGLPKDHEWISFVQRDDRFVDPRLPIRSVEEIVYPGKYHPAAAEVRAGMLERKSKYLKSYTAGWYVFNSFDQSSV
ncbi:MAG: hypothetical protein M1825_000034 [Sarcosagium campestre]|nr:MAG: hypothetical protein M1825_000034 [Sarcosagium campestre]